MLVKSLTLFSHIRDFLLWLQILKATNESIQCLDRLVCAFVYCAFSFQYTVLMDLMLMSSFLCLHSPKERNLCLCSLSWIISGVCMTLWSLEGNFLINEKYTAMYAFPHWNWMCCKMQNTKKGQTIFVIKYKLFLFSMEFSVIDVLLKSVKHSFC